MDDERIVAQDISECLIQMGCEVCGTALSGSEAIFKAGELSPDLILMDVVLQGDMDGIDAAKIIRERFDIPCVFLTAYSDEGVLSRAKLTEPAGYIVKPFEESGLRSTVEIALHKVDTEKALRESHEWFATTLMSIGDGVIATNKEGMIRFMNPVAESLTGWKSEEAAGSHLSEIFRIFNERTRQPAKNPALIALESGLTENLEDEAVLVCRDNSIIPIDDSGAPIRDRHERVVGAVLVFRDMTEQRAAAAKIKQHQEHLEELVQERTCRLTQKTSCLNRRSKSAAARRLPSSARWARRRCSPGFRASSSSSSRWTRRKASPTGWRGSANSCGSKPPMCCDRGRRGTTRSSARSSGSPRAGSRPRRNARR
ncbi:MAG: response regulator [Verrucomicrobiales bacterium]